MKKWLVLIVFVGAGVGGWLYLRDGRDAGTRFRMATVTRGDLVLTIGATGTVEPEEVVDVGAQVAGIIREFGPDPKTPAKTVDYGTEVEQGCVLARIDDSLYQAAYAEAEAMVEQAKANVLKCQADLGQMHAKLAQAENNWKRAQELGPSKALSATDFDSYKATYEVTKATLAVGQASLVQAEKSVHQAEAVLRRAKTNLSYCTIMSPVKGVIIDRRVNIGQTVVASLSAPSLFLIAKDLTKMQIWAAVNEADIGAIKPGMPVNFTVDAFAGRVFRGSVGKVRLNAMMTQNVVTYTVEIHTDNSDGTLLPYLTANVRFEVATHTDALLVPNVALRWTPASDDRIHPAHREKTKPTPSSTAASTGRAATVWVREGGFVRPIAVVAGMTDGSLTEILSGDVSEGTELVTGEIQATAKDDAASPFTPQFRGGRR